MHFDYVNILNDEDMHVLARQRALRLIDPDKKQLRFNEIIQCVKLLYPTDHENGIRELVKACDKANDDLYLKKEPMWKTLIEQYSWMIDDSK